MQTQFVDKKVTKTVTLRLREDDYDTVNNLAIEKGISRSELMRIMAEYYLQNADY